jgi:hypothetical protein
MISRDKLVSRLKSSGFSPIWDQNNIPLGDHLHHGILKLIEDSDVVVALLTQESVESKAVLEELVRAHNQHTRIYSIVEISAVTKLPWFLDSDIQLRYSSEEDLIGCIEKLLLMLARDLDFICADNLHKAIFQQHHHITHLLTRKRFISPEGRFLHDLSLAVVQNLNHELSSLVNENYECIVSEGSNFLIRAKPVFENASEIYAISNDSVSSFWVSRNILNQRLARDYLRTQPSHTIRLFVFENAESAHNYCTILNTHARVYGEVGRVYICSTESYKHIVDEFSDSDEKDKWFRSSDFAILRYSDSDGNHTSTYRATLDGKHFKVKRSSRGGGFPPVESSEVQRFFSEINGLETGEIDSTYNVLRWQIDLHKQKEIWSQKLFDLFVNRECDVIHLVFFADHAFRNNEDKEQLRQKIKDVKAILDDLKDETSHTIHCKDVWFGEYHVAAANDSRTNGRIRNAESRDFPYLLFMRFANTKSLEQWYMDDKHSVVRRRLFESFNPEITSLFAKIDEISAANPSDVSMSTIYDTIEEKASTYMGRRDYKESKTVIDIVEKTPFRPKLKFP